jgi:hypothetical protein
LTSKALKRPVAGKMLGVDGYGCRDRADEYGRAGSAHHLRNQPLDIRGVEGVYGLQQAFIIAGAKYLIMPLWQVPDRETMAFMTTWSSDLYFDFGA